MSATEENLRRVAPAPAAPAALVGAAETAESRLRSCPYLALRAVSCVYSRGVLTLRGRLPNYHLKQVALAAVAAVPGVERVACEIEVSAGSVTAAEPGATLALFI